MKCLLINQAGNLNYSICFNYSTYNLPLIAFSTALERDEGTVDFAQDHDFQALA